MLLNKGEKKVITNVRFKKLMKNCVVFNTHSTRLNEAKSLIDDYKEDYVWDYAKKVVNKYELIYMTGKIERKKSMSLYHPISRSFFKLHEILKDFNINFEGDKVVGVHLAEGPGGFMETMCYNNPDKDCKLYGITLEPTHKHIPKWGNLRKYIDKNTFKITYGNLYHLKDIDNFCDKITEKKIDIITADGGFDFSVDYNEQEHLYHRICFGELVCHFQIQSLGGCFVCKIFDIYSIFTIQVLYILYCHYEEVYICKPLSSRPANSEKYIVCKGFKGINKYFLKTIRHMLANWDNYIFNISIPNDFVKQIWKYNDDFTSNQIKYIENTISFIEKNNIDIKDKRLFKTREHIKKCKEWCKKYDIPINPYY